MRYAKAYVAAAAAGVGAMATALGDSTITVQEWLTVAGAVLGALGVVVAVPNRQP